MADKHTDEAAGRIKEAAGSITGDEKLKRKGRTDQTRASAKDTIDKAADRAKDAVSRISGNNR
jgi:uncharacterized protein YjbJ (UPF0337 family)